MSMRRLLLVVLLAGVLAPVAPVAKLKAKAYPANPFGVDATMCNVHSGPCSEYECEFIPPGGAPTCHEEGCVIGLGGGLEARCDCDAGGDCYWYLN